MNINHERLVPGAITYWGDVVGDITDQQDLVDYVASHGGGGGGDATWGSIQGNIENQTDLNNRLTDIDGLAQDAYNVAKDTSNSLTDHIAANDAAFNEAFERISALERGGGGGGVTPEEFNDHKAQNDVAFKEAFDRISALEQGGGGGGVTQEEFSVHQEQNASAFMNIDGRLTALEQGGGGSSVLWGNITGDITSQQDLIDIINDFDSRITAAVSTYQCEESGLTDFMRTSLNDSNVILAMDDYYTGDNGENRDLTIWGSYTDQNDDYRVKFGKVETTYEQDPNTQEYTVTGQTFSEMIAAEAPDTSTDATYILKATVLNGEVTYSWVPENVN